VHLTSKPFETLAVLVEHRGKTVEKQTLLDAGLEGCVS
jgi:DNA-binding winged helix-turn-helix (wHTH) protein